MDVALACIMADFLSRLPPCWTAIAERPRESTTARLHWHKVAGAPLSPIEARRLAASGAILMAQRYLPDHVELLIRPTMRPAALHVEQRTNQHGRRLRPADRECAPAG